MAKKKEETPEVKEYIVRTCSVSVAVDDGEVALGLPAKDIKNILTALDIASKEDVPGKAETCGLIAANLREFHENAKIEMPEEYKTFCKLYDPKEEYTRLEEEPENDGTSQA